MTTEPPVDEELPAPCGRTVYTIDGPDGVRSHADNCVDCWFAELQQARNTIAAAKTLLNGMTAEPHRTGTHHAECHHYHHECLVARLRTALGGTPT